MALDKDILGLAVHTVRMQFNGKTVAELVMMYGSIDNARLALTKLEMDAIIKHIQTNGVVNTTGTAAAQIGKMT